LSSDQSAKQKYHSDGIHLDSKEHQPCNAVNVFFYLIDIPVKNGGTEFYMGSHKLHSMFVDKSMVS
jgi:ectoine hydroxylase-related dioxygenase (phytanoyl-CoA dioxygenase family)